MQLNYISAVKISKIAKQEIEFAFSYKQQEFLQQTSVQNLIMKKQASHLHSAFLSRATILYLEDSNYLLI